MDRDFDPVLLFSPNGVAVSNTIATGFNLWNINAGHISNAVGMEHKK
jgi:hypothetical protein